MQGWGIKPGIGKYAAMAGAIRAERFVARATRIICSMALRAGLVDGLVMQVDPIGVAMRIRFDPITVDLDLGHQILWTGDNGN